MPYRQAQCEPRTERASARPVRRAAAGGVLALVLLVLLADPAAAHTELRASEPPAGATVEHLERLELRFTEAIEVSASHVWINDSAGFLELPTPTSIDGDGRSLTVPVPPLGDGTYEVTWHVVATDGTPVQGTYTVEVQSPQALAPPTTLVDPAADPPPDTSLAVPLSSIRGVSKPPDLADHGHGPSDVTRGITRGLLDLSLAVLVGGIGFVLFVWRRGGAVVRTRQLLLAASTAAAVCSFELSAFQLAGATGTSTFAALAPGQMVKALDFHFGRVAAARLLLLGVAILVIGALAARANRPVPSRRWAIGAGVLAVALAETLVLLGHGSGAVSLAGAARLTHVLGMSAWLGGLVVLVAVVLPRRRTAELLQVLPRFSAYATWAIAVLVVGGVLLSADLVGGVGALTTSDYGRVLLAKLVLVGLLLMAASMSRNHVRFAIRAGSSADGTAIARPLLVWAGTEVGLMVAVMAVTAVLVTRVPPG